MKKHTLFIATLAGLVVLGFDTSNADAASPFYLQVGGCGFQFDGPGYCYRNDYRGGHYDWHDTSHYDWHPGHYRRHYDHYDYVPGHYDFHRSGHWDFHPGRHHRGGHYDRWGEYYRERHYRGGHHRRYRHEDDDD